MLILTRKLGEAVKIGEHITITVLGNKGPFVRLGIDAPRTVTVHREEVFDRIKNEESAQHAHRDPD